MRATELMTPNPSCCSASDSLEDVARIMRDSDCGSVPIVDEAGCLVGIITDRDLAVRGFAEGKKGDTKVKDLMTSSPYCCTVDDDIRAVERTMSENQVRRVPIVDSAGCCVGIIAQADLARAAEQARVSEHEVAIVVEKISEPELPSLSRGPGELEQRL